ncbi:hypothetical protein [Cytobacillus oceanisediminis]|uniref:hypothetical protein n=1 Tax=Cytobacillus oceanisediminis TaxID=665099 RepID=UPI0037369A47
MDKEIIVSLISNITTIIVGIITAIVAYKGSIRGAKEQIEHERQLLNATTEEQKVFAQMAIERFISNEIKMNFKQIFSKNLANSLNTLNQPFDSYINTAKSFSFEEFNKVKYELIKTKSNSIEKIIKIYDMFYLIERKNDISRYTHEEFKLLKEAYSICLLEYWEK